ncbi:YozD family protein [Heyndrickxia coagulans]|uniref:YozD family protein n=1 Tax=Heyndrickxia coagulans TaxID=1398 RepID=UPI00035C386D|nr:YozD family protein [Heyndrickxia coagulans]
MENMDVYIDTEEIAAFFFKELVKRGFAPREEELDEIVDITFEYLLAKSIIDEEYEDDSI